MEHKKGIQLSGAFGAILAVVLVAVLVIIGIFLFEVLEGVGTNQANTITNESGAYINATGYRITGATACGYNSGVIVLAVNSSSGIAIPASNYTFAASTGIITNTSSTNYDNVNLTYTFNDRGQACNASQDMVTQFATYPALVGLVGTIVFLGLVIGILVAAFVFGKREV